jgi:hypothetical protein
MKADAERIHRLMRQACSLQTQGIGAGRSDRPLSLYHDRRLQSLRRDAPGTLPDGGDCSQSKGQSDQVRHARACHQLPQAGSQTDDASGRYGGQPPEIG